MKKFYFYFHIKTKMICIQQLESERANTAQVLKNVYTKLVTQKADLEQQVKDMEERFSEEEEVSQ